MQPVSSAPVHWSNLRHMARSAAHYRASLDAEREPTPAMRFGTLVHGILLGGADVSIWEGDARRGKAWESFAADHAHRTIVTRAEYDRGSFVAESVDRHPKAKAILTDARYEVPAEWAYSGRSCATRGIDILGRGYIADLKTTTDARPAFFSRHAKIMGYIGQLAWYAEAARKLGEAPFDWYLIAAETAAPYAVSVLQLTSSAQDYGSRSVRLLMEQLRVCEDSGVWPAYCDAAVPLDVEQADDLVFGDEAAE
jgi:hypothetical protein